MSQSFIVNPNAALEQGSSISVINEAPTQSGTTTRLVKVAADGILLSVFVRSLVGSLNITIYAVNSSGARSKLFTFPQINAATSEVILRTIGPTLSLIEVQCQYTGACDYELDARGVSLAEVSTKSVPSKSFLTGKVILGTLPVVLIPATTASRTAVLLKNLSNFGTIYIGGSLDEASLATGFPVGPGESFGVEIVGGQAIYAIGTHSGIDIRYMEAQG